jgi:hypothetical protein
MEPVSKSTILFEAMESKRYGIHQHIKTGHEPNPAIREIWRRFPHDICNPVPPAIDFARHQNGFLETPSMG